MPQSPGFNPRSVHVGYVAELLAMGQASLRVLRFAPVSIIPPTNHMHSFIYHRHNTVTAIDSVVNRQLKTKLNSVALVRERTIPTERPPPVGED
jgi:hypothetical protein